jgi:hypothetical protein
MTPEVPWGTAAKPLLGWAFKHLPTFIFKKFYNLRNLKDDIKIRLAFAALETAKLAGKLRVPCFRVGLEVFNMSPYLDVYVRGVRAFLMVPAEGGVEDIIADLDDWTNLDLPCGQSRGVHLKCWLNEFQMAVMSTPLKGGLSMRLYVVLHVESRIGPIKPSKSLGISNPCGQQTGVAAE